MKLIAITALLAVGQAAAAQAAPAPSPITIPLASPSALEQTVAPSLMVRIEGNEAGFDIKASSKGRVRGCPQNLIHGAPHGPDMSEVMPWHVSSQYFPNRRLIPVCGQALAVEITLVSPELSPDGKRFTSGQLVVALKPSQPAP